MLPLLGKKFVLQEVTKTDLAIASITWGFTLGVGLLTTWTAIKQTSRIKQRHGTGRLNTPYIWMIWLEILVCLAMSVICWLYLFGVIPPSFIFYFWILTFWALQVQFLLQIIINRIAILLPDRQKANRIRFAVAFLITAINISVYCIWVPARLQISERFEQINTIWDRCEKVIYLIIDAALNFYFIYIVQQRLVSLGLKKYDRLVRFNKYIIAVSLSMDILIISMMSLRNSFVYMQFHPLAYIIKLNIEMSMADLIVEISTTSQSQGSSMGTTNTRPQTPEVFKSSIDPRVIPLEETTRTFNFSKPVYPKSTTPIFGKRASGGSHMSDNYRRKGSSVSTLELFTVNGETHPALRMGAGNKMEVNMQQEVHISVEELGNGEGMHRTRSTRSENDEGTLLGVGGDRESVDRSETASRHGLKQGMGVHTTVWAPNRNDTYFPG